VAALIDPWPGTPGGAYSPAWGEAIRLYVQAAIWRGTTFRWAPAPAPDQNADTWSAGNVWGSGSVPGPPAPPVLTNRLWVDLTCAVLDLETHLGGTRADGALARSEAATAHITLADPTRVFDPLNPDSPFAYQGTQSRLMPGTPVMVWAETVDDPTDTTITHHRLFTGTVDTWAEPWTPRPAARRATVVASDETKTLVGLDRGEQPRSRCRGHRRPTHRTDPHLLRLDRHPRPRHVHGPRGAHHVRLERLGPDRQGIR
jgi:hypothetical protein